MDDVWLSIWEEGGSSYVTVPSEEPRVDAAVTRYVESGGTRDTVLTLDLADGRTYKTRASVITSWAISTPETRRTALEYSQWQAQEERDMKADLGIWDD